MSAAAQPLVVVTEWGTHGAVLLAMLLCAVAGAALLYRATLRRVPPPRLAFIVVAAGAGLILCWLSPVLFSSDVYAYAAYGELARLGLDPYARAAGPALHDPLVRAAVWQWSGTLPICVYGPAFVAFAKAIVTTLAPFAMLGQLNGFRIAAGVAFLLCGPLAFVAYDGNRTRRLRAAATLMLNPAAIWCVAEGHNDAIALSVVLAGFAATRRGYGAVGGALAALAALVKLPGAIAAVGLAVANRRTRVGVVAGTAIAAAFSLPLFAGVTGNLAPHGTYAPQASLQAVVAPFSPALAVAVAALFGATLAVAGVRRLLDRDHSGWAWLGLAGWVLVPNPYPWYGLWLLALAAIAPESPAGQTAILLSLTATLRYLPDAVAPPAAFGQAALGLLASLPFVALVPRRRVGLLAAPGIMSDPE